MVDRFSIERAKKVDSKGVHTVYERWPSLARDGFAVDVELSGPRVKKVFVLGMGGSAAGGDIIAGWLADRPGVQVAVFKGQLPIGDLGDAIAIACSASGNTAETIDMLETALKRGARAISISGGGRLREVSHSLGIPHIDMPKFIAPRYVFPFILYSTLAVVNRSLGLECEREAEDSISEMGVEWKGLGIDVPPSSNPAKALAADLLRKVPVIYGARVTRGVGIRFKNVLNENSKKHALFDGIPDAFHNDVESWEDDSRDFAPVFLRHSGEAESDRVREERMMRLLSKAGYAPIQVQGRGNTSLAELVTMEYRLDMATYYLAIGLGRDPYPTRLMDALKKGP